MPSDSGLYDAVLELEEQTRRALETIESIKKQLKPAAPASSFEDRLAEAVRLAKSRINNDKAGEVLAALDKAGAERVSTLTEDNIETFLEALNG